MSAKLALKIAIRKAGGMRALGRKLNVSYQNIQYWVENNKVPSQWLIEIEKATGVEPHELRPDLFRGYTRIKELEPA